MTEKAKLLKESLLRVHAGWGSNSKMPQVYLHYFVNESSETLLEAYGIKTKENQQQMDSLLPRQCSNCGKSCKVDARFFLKCRMVLTYDAYSETIEEKHKSNIDLETLKQ